MARRSTAGGEPISMRVLAHKIAEEMHKCLVSCFKFHATLRLGLTVAMTDGNISCWQTPYAQGSSCGPRRSLLVAARQGRSGLMGPGVQGDIMANALVVYAPAAVTERQRLAICQYAQ